jgi:hypothetical protein
MDCNTYLADGCVVNVDVLPHFEEDYDAKLVVSCTFGLKVACNDLPEEIVF